MPIITLPDGSEKKFDRPVSGFDVAADIGPGLAKAALAMTIDGKDLDLSSTIADDASVRFLTAKDAAGLDVLRHTLAAQVLARAVKDLYPQAKLAIGPTIDHGFYYDVSLPDALSADDLERIETRMREIVSDGLPVTRELWPRDRAIAYFDAKGETYKAEIIRAAPADEHEVSLYRQGRDDDDVFMDLCYGPHLPNVGKAGRAFKLTSVAGAYWRGDSNNEMLTRIYGTAWPDEKALKAHLKMLEEAAKRDHRRLAKQLELFHIQEDAPGMVFWHPKGWTLWQTVEQYLREELQQAGYQEIKTPQIADRKLWERSGHWDNYREHMFVTESEKRVYALKPMNCPCHVQVFNHGLHSYRDLPIRLAEFGSCHRNEYSGALHGLMRVRGFVQDDAHIFCTDEQVVPEVVAFNTLLTKVYADFGFTDIGVKLALRPDQRMGEDATWERAEQGLREALQASAMSWEELPGEGAFYGPKIEYHLQDTIGRSWQCGTMQLDFMLPERLDAEYVDERSERQRPVMLHRAIFGSMERFLGILIENYAAHFPLWLAPVQAVVMGITDRQNAAVTALGEQLQAAGLRVRTDLRNEKVNYKVREHSLQKIPVQLVLGDREIENGTVTVRRLGSKAQTTLAVAELVAQLEQEIASKRVPQLTAQAA